jgi:hypothetical protein
MELPFEEFTLEEEEPADATVTPEPFEDASIEAVTGFHQMPCDALPPPAGVPAVLPPLAS